jgi:hypothetical protein
MLGNGRYSGRQLDEDQGREKYVERPAGRIIKTFNLEDFTHSPAYARGPLGCAPDLGELPFRAVLMPEIDVNLSRNPA